MGLDDDDRAAFADLGFIVVEDPEESGSAAIAATEVWSTNWPALIVFLDLATQWREVCVANQLVRTGLRYAEVDRMIARHGADPEVFWDVQILEQAALPVLNEGDS